MLKAYVSGGLDPARFWEITPRLFDLEMRGVLARVERERGLAWETAMLGRAQKPPSFDEFTGIKKQTHPEETLGLHLRAANKGLKVMSLDEWRAKKARGY